MHHACFLDTEFTDFIDCELISIGMVAVDGTQFYAEVQDFNRSKCNQFVLGAVLGRLGQIEGASVTRAALSVLLREWFASLPEGVTVACDNSTDWDLFREALDNNLPPNVVDQYDLAKERSDEKFNRAVITYHDKPGCPWHHALHDALGYRAGWLALHDADSDPFS